MPLHHFEAPHPTTPDLTKEPHNSLNVAAETGQLQHVEALPVAQLKVQTWCRHQHVHSLPVLFLYGVVKGRVSVVVLGVG